MADRPGHEELQAFLKSTFHILSKNRKVNSPTGPTNLAGYAKCTLCGTDDIINSRGAKLRHLAHPRCQRQERLPEWVDKLAQEMQEKRRRDNARSMRRKRTAAKAAEDSSQIMNNAAAEHSLPVFYQPCSQQPTSLGQPSARNAQDNSHSMVNAPAEQSLPVEVYQSCIQLLKSLGYPEMQLGEDHLIVLSLKPPEPVAQIEAENLVKLTGNIALELP